VLPDTAQSFRGTLYIHVWIRFLNWKKKKKKKIKESLFQSNALPI
jgi:hypothetical protein